LAGQLLLAGGGHLFGEHSHERSFVVVYGALQYETSVASFHSVEKKYFVPVML
jgi:hypothetical protein